MIYYADIISIVKFMKLYVKLFFYYLKALSIKHTIVYDIIYILKHANKNVYLNIKNNFNTTVQRESLANLLVLRIWRKKLGK